MKTLKYILLGILLTINLVACEPPTINEEIGIDQVEKFAVNGDNLELEDGDEN